MLYNYTQCNTTCYYHCHDAMMLTGHPDFVHIGDQVKNLLCSGKQEQDGDDNTSNTGAHVVVIGQGNVALDCARILAKGGAPPSSSSSSLSSSSGNGELYNKTDIASYSLPILKQGVAQTTIVGRRGHVQGAFTIKVCNVHCVQYSVQPRANSTAL
jgi:adrenodoxin-NADP+ reductase